MTTRKPLWLEGMFVQPHHFQLQDRHHEALLATRAANLRPYAWGVVRLQVDEGLIPLGRIGLSGLEAVMPDGTVVDLPGARGGPEALTIPASSQGRRVLLAIPRRRAGGPEVVAQGEARFPTRLVREDQSVVDATVVGGSEVSVATGALNLSLVLDDGDTADLVTLPVAKIRDLAADGSVVLDLGFVPPLLDTRGSPALLGLVDELIGLLVTRGEALAGRVREPTSGAPVSSISDLLGLQLVNRYQALTQHLRSLPALHPEVLYRVFVSLAAEVATFAEGRRPVELPPYRHDDLWTTFSLALSEIRQALSTASEEPAIQLPLQERRHGVYVSLISDHSLVASARLVLSVSAEVATEEVRTSFPRQVKVGPVEDIRELVTLQLQGIPLRPLPAVPRQLPYHTGATYFELDKSVELWGKMEKSAAFGLHVSGAYPGLRLEFWAIRSRS